jgi:hypothetical protein
MILRSTEETLPTQKRTLNLLLLVFFTRLFSFYNYVVIHPMHTDKTCFNLLINYMYLSSLRPLSGCSTSLPFKYKRIDQLH